MTCTVISKTFGAEKITILISWGRLRDGARLQRDPIGVGPSARLHLGILDGDGPPRAVRCLDGRRRCRRAAREDKIPRRFQQQGVLLPGRTVVRVRPLEVLGPGLASQAGGRGLTDIADVIECQDHVDAAAHQIVPSLRVILVEAPPSCLARSPPPDGWKSLFEGRGTRLLAGLEADAGSLPLPSR